MSARRLVLFGLAVVLASSGVKGFASVKSLGAPATGTAPVYRYVYNPRGPAGAAAAAHHGWNLIDVGSQSAARALPKGARGLVWVGDYDNATCDWQISDRTLRKKISAMARDFKVAGFFFSDEPDPTACPAAPGQHRARSSLLHKLSPNKFTVMVMDSNSGDASLAQMPLWAGAADFVGLNPYPCYQDQPCDFAWIDTIIAAADQAGLSYWGAVQAFGDSRWRWPTPDEERHMLAQWTASKWSGYMTFSWTWAGSNLSSQTDLLALLKEFNAGSAGLTATRHLTSAAAPTAPVATQVHYSFTGPTSVTFNWKGGSSTIRYGLTKKLKLSVTARPSRPTPFSSSGPFWEARLTGLKPGTTYRYSIGSGRGRTFATAPTGRFRFVAIGDIGSSLDFSGVASTQKQIAAANPAFVLGIGDLTYADDEGVEAVDQHFNDVMVWSRKAAYMPAWGNHEWGDAKDDLRNYKGRFAIPNAHASPGAPREGCCGEDWGWFDAGGVRFISYPEPYTGATWEDWQARARPILAAAQANPSIRFIVTFGHRPAYSTGYHSGDEDLAAILDAFGDRYSKYVLNLNGHSHNYERYRPIHGVVHITAGGGGASLEPWSGDADALTARRAMHLAHVRVDVSGARMRIQAVCGPATSDDETSCAAGAVIDSVTLSAER